MPSGPSHPCNQKSEALPSASEMSHASNMIGLGHTRRSSQTLGIMDLSGMQGLGV